MAIMMPVFYIQARGHPYGSDVDLLSAETYAWRRPDKDKTVLYKTVLPAMRMAIFNKLKKWESQ